MRKRRSLSAPVALLLGLLAIAVTILVLANEVRFQGCIARQDRQLQMLTAKTSGTKVTECSRIPFAAG